MCSTPKPKRKTKGKSAISSTSILSSMNSNARKEFAKRANTASVQRRSKTKLQQVKTANSRIVSSQAVTNIANKKASKTKTNKSWFYWLLTASIAEIIKKIVLRH